MRTEYSEVSGAVKYDDGKVPACRGLTDYFPRALCAVADVSAYGFEKYKGWNGWRHVPDRIKRYLDGMMRHHLYEARGQLRDPESKRLHAAHRAWNALAVLEAMLEDAEVHASDQSTVMQDRRAPGPLDRRKPGGTLPYRRHGNRNNYGFAIDRTGKMDRRKH